MKESVAKLDLDREFYTQERCYITEVSNSPADPAVSIARVRVTPATTTAWHTLEGVAERYIMLTGQGVVELGGALQREVVPGDVVIIPPGCPQRIVNTGVNDLLFMAVCTPRFTVAAYRDIEDQMH